MRFSKSILAVFLLAAMTASFAQTTGSGTITGRVTDAQNLPIAGAAVVVRSTDTGTERALTTNEVGIYVATFLQPGAYEVSAKKEGFATMTRKDLTLQVGQTLALELQLPVKSTQTEVTVTGEAPVVDTDKTDVSQVVTQTAKDNLPMAGRNWANFALLTPNVTADGGSGLVSYRGISGLYNSSSVDGTNNNQAFFSELKGRTTLAYVYSIDSIQEYQVATSNYSAELGQAAGGVINAVTKSGTNAIHGDLFYYLRYPTLNALDPLNKSKNILTQPIHQQQQFGGSVGGPLMKDKLFGFLTYDGSRKVFPVVYTSSGTYPQTCLATVPSASCAAANAYVVSQLGAFARFQYQDIAFGKLDYNYNPANRLNISFNFLNFRGPNSYQPNPTYNNSSLGANGKVVTHERNLVASWSSTINPTTINSFKFQWSRDLAITGANAAAPSVTVTNFLTYGLPNALPRPAFPDEHRLQFSDVLNKVHGKHTFKVGVDFNFIHELLINLFQGAGVYTYSGTNTFSNWVADVTGANLGDGLTGRHFATFVQVTDPVTGVGKDDFYNNDYAFFVEDSWKPKPNLTFNLGVRYDVNTIPAPEKPNLATPLTTLYTSTINIPKNQIAPRLGMAWQVSKGNVLRVGYGIFYAKTSNSMFYATRVENGVIQQTFNCNPTTCPTLRFPNLIFTPPGGAPTAPFPGALVPQVTSFTPPSLTQTSRGQVPDFANPRAHEADVTFEHQLPGNMSISASYIATRGQRLPVFVDTNLLPSTTTRTYDIVSSTGSTLRTLTVPFYANNVGPNNSGRIDPTGPVLTGFSDANSWYHSFVLTLRKPFSRGLEFLFNYTLSRNRDSGELQGNSGTFNGGGTNFPVDPKNRKLEAGLSDLDQRQRFSGSVVWKPDWDKHVSNSAAKFLVGGWTFSSIVSIYTGQPVTGTINGNPAGAVLGGLTGGTNNNSGTALNGARLYDEVRNSFTGPGAGNVDFRIGRTFSYKEKIHFSILGEAFNLFNFTNFYSVLATEYNYAAVGSGVCTAANGHTTNNCVVQNFGTNVAPTGSFFYPTNTNNALSGARQLQIAARFSF